MAAHILWYYWDHNDVSRMTSFWDAQKKNLDKDEYVGFLLDLYWDQNEEGQRNLRRELIEVKDHTKVAALMGDFKRQEEFLKRREEILKLSLVELDKPFDPEAFNPRLEKFLLEIKKLSDEVKPLLASEHGKIREQTNQQLQGFYGKVADKLQTLNVVHEDKDFVASFQSEMHKIAKVFQTKVVDFKKATRRPSGDLEFVSPVQAKISISTMDQYSAGGRK